MKKTSFVLFLVAALAIAYAAFLAIAFAAQPPLDMHAFRQTQTALTAYWFMQDGFRLAYETPVAGAPFAIPFEFPIYQAIVAALTKVLKLPLDVVGRLTSFVFLLLCLLPARSVTRSLKLPETVFWCFAALLFSAPLYVYWGRSFMIETAALFFSLGAIAAFLDYLLRTRSAVSLLLFAAFATLAVLQKATSWLPVVPVLGVAWLAVEGRSSSSMREFVCARRTLLVAASFLVPILVGSVWVRFSDQVKLLNPLGRELTSSALVGWNLGTLAQRISGGIWTTVVWRRILVQNLGAPLALLVLAAPFLLPAERRTRWIVSGALAMGILPLFVFTNLHLVHTYYQSANAVYFLYAAAVAIGAVLLPRMGAPSAVLILGLVLAANYAVLDSEYLGAMEQRFAENDRDVAIGGILRREMPADQVFVAFGNDWSSSFAYMAQRKSFTVPGWFQDYAQIARQPERFVAAGRLGAVVSCSRAAPAAPDIVAWAAQGRSWKVGETHGCVMAVPQAAVPAAVDGEAACQGAIDLARLDVRNGRRTLAVAGWTASAAGPPTIPEHVFVAVSAANQPTRYFDTLKVFRPDLGERLHIADDVPAGFSRLIAGDWSPGEYELALVHYSAGRYQRCLVTRRVTVPQAR
jgi:hypothetical protein